MQYFTCLDSIKNIQPKNKSKMHFHQKEDQIVKFIMVGDNKVGKTSIMNSYCYGNLKDKQHRLKGCLNYAQKVTEIFNKKVLIQIWDTAPGQQKYYAITPSYYRSAMGIALVFSVDDKQSFNSITVWLKQIHNYLQDEIPIILVCNKSDLKIKQVSDQQAQKIAAFYKLELIKTSVKDNINIEEVFVRLYIRTTQIPMGKALLLHNKSLSILLSEPSLQNLSDTKKNNNLSCYTC